MEEINQTLAIFISLTHYFEGGDLWKVNLKIYVLLRSQE